MVDLYSFLSSKDFCRSTSLTSQSDTIIKIFSSLDLPSLLEDVNVQNNLQKLFNYLLYIDKCGDSLPNNLFTQDIITKLLHEGFESSDLSVYDYFQVKEDLGDLAITCKFCVDGESEEFDGLFSFVNPEFESRDSKPLIKSSTNIEASKSKGTKIHSKSTEVLNKGKKKKASTSKRSKSDKLEFNKDDIDFWIASVSLERPLFPQPDYSKIELAFEDGGQEYCIYGEAVLPWTQSHISCVSDVNRFKDSDVRKLFPPIHLYTRSPFMYQQYDKLDYVHGLGVIIPIPGFTDEQLKRNIVKYPHFDIPDRWVTVNGKEKCIPFWQHIEIDGEMHKTTSVWGEFPGTENLPKTEAFMNEFVVRRYILEMEYHKVQFKHKMRGTLGEFLTLYDTADYYSNLGYDPIEIGRQCIMSRQSYKYTRNPVIRKYEKLFGNTSE